MAVFGAKPDDVITAPDAERYKPREPKAVPAQTDIQNFGLARLIDAAATYRNQQSQDQYREDLGAVNQQRVGINDVIMAAEAEMERRKQNLDYGKGLGDKIAQSPIMTAEGVPGGEETGAFDAANLENIRADASKKRADANKVTTDAKSPIEFRQDEFGKQVMIIKDPVKVLADPRYREMLSPEQIKRMQGGTNAVNNIADRAAEATKPVAPTGGKVGKSTYKLINSEQQQDGTFIADVVGADGKSRGRFRVDSSGAMIGRAE